MNTTEKELIYEIINSAQGTEKYNYRNYYRSMVYTDSIMKLQEKCNMYWFVDLVISHMPSVLEDFKETEETFYIVEIKTDDEQRAVFTINKEVYDEDFNCTIQNVCLQEIPYVDLPVNNEYKFYLELAQYEPIIFCLMCVGDR